MAKVLVCKTSVLFVLASLLACARARSIPSQGDATRAPDAATPNILLIAIDDLNDWVACLGGHVQAKTPNIDRLAARGVLFANAHCQSPVCNPSRASMMTGLYPESTGIYFLSPDLARSRVASEAVLLPRRFANAGYDVEGAGKIFHGSQNKKYMPHYAGSFGGFGPRPADKKKLSPFPGHPLWDWGAFPERDAQMPDARIAAYGVDRLRRERDRPFLLATGFYRPHVPQYAPQKYFDLYPEESLVLPPVLARDLEDVPSYGVVLTRRAHVAPTHAWVQEHEQWKALVRSYLACVSFVDAQVGVLLDALDASPHAKNTIVVLYSDHGFHLGEKQRWAKRSLWEEATRVPLILAGPGIARGKVCRKPVELVDVYPTLVELAGLERDSRHEGQSLAPLLVDVDAVWPHFARTSFGPGNVAIRSERYRYVRYRDGSEELYDHVRDPHEWHNCVNDPKLTEVVGRHRDALPDSYHAVLGANSTGHRAFKAAEARAGKVRGGKAKGGKARDEKSTRGEGKSDSPDS